MGGQPIGEPENKNSNFSKSRRLNASSRTVAGETEPFVVVSAAASNANSATARSTRIWIAVLR